MNPVSLLIIAAGNITLGIIAWVYFKRFQAVSLKHAEEVEGKDKELRRQVLELQVMRSLGERVGYSLDLRQIVDVLTDSLSGLVDFSSISFMLPGKDGRIIFKTRLSGDVSRAFLTSVKEQMVLDLSIMIGQNIYPNLVDETTAGEALDNSAVLPVKSFFNLPIIIGGRVVALINVSSFQEGLYGDEDTAFLYTILGQVSTQSNKLIQVVENEKKRLSAMVASLADGVMMVDMSLNLIVSNRVLPGILGLSQIKSLFDVVAVIGKQANIEGAIKYALSYQTMVKLPEFSLGEKVVQIDVEPVKDSSNNLLGAVVVFHDTSERKKLEKLRDEFTAMMVHELRTPLTTVKYSTDMVISDLPKMSTEEVGKNIELISTTASHMLELVGELLDVAKIEAGKFQIVKKDNDLKSLVEEKATAFKSLVDQKQLEFLVTAAPDLPVFPFDRQRISQVLDNLLSNSIKYTDSGKVELMAKVSGEGSGQQVQVIVKDSGEGIVAEDLPKLFSKFEQLGKGKTGEKVGTGLGLVVAKGIVEAHGGKIWANSPGHGQGSTFTFTLPLS